MEKNRFRTMALAIVVLFPVLLLSGTEPGQTSAMDKEALAKKLVVQVAGIHENDIVLINGGFSDRELLEDIAVEVRKLGAFPLISVGSERMIRKIWAEVTAKYDSQSPDFDLKMAGIVTAVINVDFVQNQWLLADVPPARLQAAAKAGIPVGELLMRRNVRQVNLGNDMSPTIERARQFGIPSQELSRIYWNGIDVDYANLQAKGETVKAVLSSGKEVHITNPNGTDLKVRIEGRPVYVSDGVISADDMKRGGAACEVWLPAGEAYLAPVLGSAEGKVVVDHEFFQGKSIEGLTLNFQSGKLTSMSAKSGIESLKAVYDAAGSGKDLFAVIDVGLNPNVHIPPGSRLAGYMPAGMVTVGIGTNTWAGGDNDAGFGSYYFLPGSTLTVDGKMLVENGVLKD